ncbi:hypothetical protein PIB30_109702 [Stylosanthes scabra]|uniref:Uncharacterized protein n=1 Tax=Stylosanthes scabra TaxID=79078 RepID=A0ABU6XYX5_9FABA|nr:hypothetical protein [Stylosanthes scabra]
MEVHTADPLEAMAKQISTMTKKLEKLDVAAVSPFGTTSLPCGLCGGPHDSQICSFIMDDQSSAEQNQESALSNLETQVGQLAKDLGQLTRSTNTFPSDTVVNPKEECKAVTLRSGKVLVDNFDKKVEEKGEDKTVEDSPVKSTTEEAKPLGAPSSSLQIPFPQRL